MNCTGTSEATFKIGKKVVDCCEIDLWHTLWSPDTEGGDVRDWSLEMIEELAIASGMAGGRIIPPGEEQDPECYGSVGDARVFDIVCQSGSDSMHFINDPKIEAALDLWREQDNMDDIDGPSYFTQWDQSLNETTWVTDGNPRNNHPVLVTPEMLQQRDKLNILWDEQCGKFLHDQLVTLEVVAIGANHGIAKSEYGGVFLNRGTLSYVQKDKGGLKIGDKFRCWITFVNRKHPWRTVVNGVVN